MREEAALEPEVIRRGAVAATPDFDGVARVYRWLECAAFGPWLWWCRCAFLAELADCRHALVMGDGDGRFTARLLAINPRVRIHAVDASVEMLRLLVRRAGRDAARMRVDLADVRRWHPAAQRIDLIVTHFFLDCLTTAEVADLASKLRGCVTPGSLWVVSEFAVPENWFGGLVAGPIVGALYRAFGLLTGLKVRQLPDHAAALGMAGFTLLKRRPWLKGLLVSELWTAGTN
jgi:hypothetical protein